MIYIVNLYNLKPKLTTMCEKILPKFDIFLVINNVKALWLAVVPVESYEEYCVDDIQYQCLYRLKGI